MQSARPLLRSRPRIAFLCNDVRGRYQDRLASGAKRAALNLGADFICFVGGYFTDNGRVSSRIDASFIYDLARAPAVDGLVIATTVLANEVGVDYIREFSQKSGLPVVSVGWLPGFPHVLPDNRSGLRAVIEHLIRDHRRERFAFIRGCAGNPESHDRESEFRAVLESHNLPVREELILPGAFILESGALAVRELFDKRRIRPEEVDAIVAANDQMASGAMRELLLRGLSIPGDIAVTGFDDDDHAAFTQPPLTTVRQPLERIGQRAVALLLDNLNGRGTPEVVQVETMPVIRNSCGCARRNRAITEPVLASKPRDLPKLDRLRNDCREAAIPLFGVGPHHIDRGSEALLDGLEQALSGLGVDLDWFQRAVSKTAADGDDPIRWQDILQMAEAELDRQRFADPEQVELGRWFLVQANLLVTEIAARAQAADEYAPHHFVALEVLNSALVLAEDEEALTKVLTATLPALGIRFCCVCLFQDTLPERSRVRVLAAYDSSGLPAAGTLPGFGAWWSQVGRSMGLPADGLDLDSQAPTVFAAENLLPESLRTEDVPTFLSVHPLSFARKPLGYAVFDQAWRHGHPWAPRAVAERLSSAVHVLRQAEHLRQARLSAEAASTAKSEFVARMSHEIRTPLTAVIGYLDLCLDRVSTPNERRYLTQARASSKVLLGVLNNILDFSKIESQQLELEHTRFDLDQVLDQIVATCATSAFSKNVELVLDVAPEVSNVLRGDPLRLTQVLVNLVGNAVKFTAQGEVVLSIDRAPEAGNAALRFRVRDTGIGIAPENLSKLMAPFVQADSSTTRRYGGTGLGLAISQRLIHRMGGSLSLQSEVGRGTDCSFSLEFSGESECRCQDDSVPWPKLRICVVDHNAASLQVVTRLLARTGCGVSSANDGEAALDLMRQARQHGSPYHVLLLDQGLPDRTGSDVVRRLVELELVGDCRILIMAPLGELESSVTLLAPEAISGIVSKPVRRNALDAQISSLFGRVAGESPVQPRDSKRPDARAVLGGKRVLVVQDDETNRMLTKEILEYAGFEVQAVESGVEAVRRVAESRYDAVLMDLHLPLMDGCEATRIIRRTPDGAELPIIALTASSSVEDRGRCFDVGMNDWVQTPIDAADLLAMLAEWVRPREGQIRENKAGPRRIAPLSSRSRAGNATEVSEVGSDWLDVRGALQRLRDDSALYRRLLRSFLATHCQSAHQLRDPRRTADLVRSVHTLSSAAANVGALQLHRVAQGLEFELRAGGSGSEALWAHLESALTKTRELVIAASGNSTNPPPSLVDRNHLRNDLKTLATLLDRFDVGASDLADKLPAIVGSGAINEEVRRIQREVRAYDFEGAAQRVKTLLATLEAQVS